MRGVLKLCISTAAAAAASHALILSIGRKTLLPYSALPFLLYDYKLGDEGF